MHRYNKSSYFVRVAVDLVTLLLCFLVSVWFSIHFSRTVGSRSPETFFVVVMLVWLVSANITRLYDEFRSTNFAFEISALLKSVALVVVSMIVYLFFLKDTAPSRFFVTAFTIIFTCGVILERLMVRKGLASIRRRGKNRRNVLIVGAGETGRGFLETIRRNPQFGYSFVGFVDDEQMPDLNGQFLGPTSELDRILDEKTVGDVIIALPGRAANRVEELIQVCQQHTTRVKIIPSYSKFTSGKYNVSMFGRFPIVSVGEDRINELYWRLVKRGFDVLFTAVISALILWWLCPLIGLAIKLSSPGPVFFKQERWGRDNRRFTTFKFRSMMQDSTDVDQDGHYLQAAKDDPRVTKIGRFLRKTNLDELPQFLNVLKGDMSVVGPRPHPTPLNIESKDSIPSYLQRHLVKPGVTGWAQINGYRGETRDPLMMHKRIEYDLWYIENWSFALDMRIILMTASETFRGSPNAY